MPFVRVFSSGVDRWYADPTDLKSLYDPFRTKGRPSIYQAESAPDEVTVVAAHVLSDPLAKVESRMNIVRLLEADFDKCGLRCDARLLGTTGVVAIDFAHFEIEGDETRIQDLIKHLYLQIRYGEDRVRSIYRAQIRKQLQSFQQWPSEDVTPYALRRCQELLDEQSHQKACLPETYVEGEYDQSQPRIPHHRIAFRAYEKSLSPRQSHLDAVSYWLEAEKELRDEYRSHYHLFNTSAKRR